MDTMDALVSQAYNSFDEWLSFVDDQPLLGEDVKSSVGGERDISAVVHAITVGRWDWVVALIKSGARVEGNTFITPVGLATRNPRILRKLLDMGLPVDSKDKDGGTPLMVAASRNGITSMQLLIDRGANVNAVNTLGITAFYVCVRSNNTGGMRYLAKWGADVNLSGSQEFSLLTMFLMMNGVLEDTLRCAIDCGVDVEGHGNNGYTALHIMVFKLRVDSVRFLLGVGASIDAKDKSGCTALHLAQSLNNVVGVKEASALQQIIDMLKAAERVRRMTLDELVADIEASGSAGAVSRKKKRSKRKEMQTMPPPVISSTHPMEAEDDILESFRCPITLSVLHDPVVAMDGHAYERCAIESWFEVKGAMSPVTNMPLESTLLIPAHCMRASIAEFKQTQTQQQQPL